MNNLLKLLHGLLIILSIESGTAQELQVCGQLGISSYGSLSIGNFGSGAGTDQDWSRGLMIGLGVRVSQSEHFSLEALVEYSSHQFQAQDSPTPLNDPRNSILELTGIGRFNISIVDPVALTLFPGISLYYQHKDEMIYSNPAYYSQGESRAGVAGVLGAGLSAKCSEIVSIYLDGSLRMRTYVTPVAVVGIAYSIK